MSIQVTSRRVITGKDETGAAPKNAFDYGEQARRNFKEAPKFTGSTDIQYSPNKTTANIYKAAAGFTTGFFKEQNLDFNGVQLKNAPSAVKSLADVNEDGNLTPQEYAAFVLFRDAFDGKLDGVITQEADDTIFKRKADTDQDKAKVKSFYEGLNSAKDLMKPTCERCPSNFVW